MEILWYCLVALLLAGYVLLDGFDLGAGALHLFVAKTEPERRSVFASIGPVWDGNEVWLLAAGGTLYFAFPALYAASFSGFYLPLIIVLWLLILRGAAIEFRNQVDSLTWRPFWDVVFWGSSALLAVFFGAALGNVIRGVPLDANQEFFLPLWTSFSPADPNPGILDWYTVLTGVLALAALLMHGALWVALKTSGPVAERSRAAARGAWWAVAILTTGATFATFSLRPQILANLAAHPWGAIFPLTAVGGAAAVAVYSRSARQELPAFLASSAYLAGMLASVVFGVYPNVLPSNTDPARSLTLWNAAAPIYGLRVGLAWWLPAFLLALGYSAFVYRKFAGKVTGETAGH
jgi:cytochrome d ubiquinol oxidase subunit II